MNKNIEQIDRVRVPGVSDEEYEQIDLFQEWMRGREALQQNFLEALFRKGQPFTGKAKPRKKPTKHQLRIRNARVRSAYLKGVAA